MALLHLSTAGLHYPFPGKSSALPFPEAPALPRSPPEPLPARRGRGEPCEGGPAAPRPAGARDGGPLPVLRARAAPPVPLRSRSQPAEAAPAAGSRVRAARPLPLPSAAPPPLPRPLAPPAARAPPALRRRGPRHCPRHSRASLRTFPSLLAARPWPGGSGLTAAPRPGASPRLGRAQGAARTVPGAAEPRPLRPHQAAARNEPGLGAGLSPCPAQPLPHWLPPRLALLIG